MGYQSRKRGYQSRREKIQETGRVLRIVLLFSSIGAALWLFMNRYELWGWMKTYIY